MKTLRIILNDQLSHEIVSLREIDADNDVILFCEAREEYQNVKHHQKKIAFLISAMRHFALELEEKGFQVVYVKLEDHKNSGKIEEEIVRIYQEFQCEKSIICWPYDYRVLKKLKKIEKVANLEIKEDERFLASKLEFNKWVENRKELRMEFFYREMRKKYKILMQADKPIGGKWNFDSDNRKFPKEKLKFPQILGIANDKITKDAIKLVKNNFSDHFGDLEPLDFAVTRKDALILLNDFICHRLKNFGDYQDAMIDSEPWLYHSVLSHYINIGLLNPLECIKKAEELYHQDKQCLSAVEGFIRQILGWREFVHGIYWLKMPEYEKLNFFNAKNKLPEFYWSAKTKMNCLSECVSQTKNNAYAHHIQRLMVLGNFALIAEIEPSEVNDWYLLVYADAWQWVEMPNVSGMILFADGGYLASKPYASSGAYINKMSNYCKNCAYDVEAKNGDNACPFNYLYWNFLIKNHDKLKNNQRLKMIYSTLIKMSPERVDLIKKDSEKFLKNLN